MALASTTATDRMSLGVVLAILISGS